MRRRSARFGRGRSDATQYGGLQSGAGRASLTEVENILSLNGDERDGVESDGECWEESAGKHPTFFVLAVANN